MRIFVTGGLGYVGTELSDRLLKEGHEVTIFDTGWFGQHIIEQSKLTIVRGDIRNFSLQLEGFDVVIHLANIANDPGVELNQTLSWEVNVLATYQLLQKAISAGVKAFIYASSGSVYGVSELEKVDEETPLVPISAYNKTKMIAEQVILASSSKIKVFNVRPATICGYSRRMRLDLAVNLLTYQALSKGEISILGGKQFRPNIHIQDMIGVYLHFIENFNYLESGNYNAGFENLTIEEIAERIRSIIPANVNYRESNDNRSYRLDSSKLIKTGFNPQKGIEDAVLELKEKYDSGLLFERDEWMTVATMKKLGLG
jgi:nucleoside-diphosphate-sugar epimerase